MWARSATPQAIPSPAKLGVRRPAGMFGVQEPEPHPWTVQAGICWNTSLCTTGSTRNEDAAHPIPFSRAQSPSREQGGCLPGPETPGKSSFPKRTQTGDDSESKRSEAMLRVEENSSNNTWELPFVKSNCIHVSETVDFSSVFAASGYQNEHVHAHTHSHPRLYPSFNLRLTRK